MKLTLARITVLTTVVLASSSAAVSISLGRRAAPTSLHSREVVSAVCTSSSSCSRSQYCEKTSSLCRSRKAVAFSCTHNVECSSGLCLASGVCSDEVSDLELGSKCGRSMQCASQFCNDGACDTPAGPGEACTKDYGCTAGVCPRNGSNNIKVYTVGQPMTVIVKDNICPSDPYVNQMIGARCFDHDQCASGFCTDQMACAMPAKSGSCSSNAACLSGICNMITATCVTVGGDSQSASAAAASVSILGSKNARPIIVKAASASSTIAISQPSTSANPIIVAAGPVVPAQTISILSPPKKSSSPIIKAA